MSYRTHPFAAPVHPLASAPSPFACGVCGHYALHQTPVSAVPGPSRLVCQVCGAHAVLWFDS